MNNNYNQPGKKHECHKCHAIEELCDKCECCKRCCEENKQPCCGDNQPPNRPPYPSAPGWTPGQKPIKSPLDDATNGDDLFKAFDKAVFEIIRTSGNPKGPKFGKRKDEYLPFLVIRANAGDRGARPFNGVFWESPDIFIAPDMDAPSAPATPTTSGGIAKAGASNTLWARIWNLGRAPVYNARVEFYWCNPSLGINSSSANMIGFTYADLGDRYSGKAQQIVKCPTTWIPSFVNNGHECLVVRVFEPLTDPLTNKQWDVIYDRHVGQRNIAVVNAASPAYLELLIKMGCSAPQGTGELQITKAQVEDVAWLSILKGKKNHGLKNAANDVSVVGAMSPTSINAGLRPNTFKDADPKTLKKIFTNNVKFQRTCAEKESLIYMHVDNLKPGECVIYRIKQIVDGKLVGGYTLIAKKD